MIRRDRLNGRFRLVENIGRGGQGTVWLAQDELLDREVALKQLLNGDRATREASALARVSHPNVVAIHDLFTVKGDPWLVMGYVLGKALSQILEAGPLGEREVATVALPVARGLIAAHRKGVVHRDVKPDNILITNEGGVVLVDFGTAQVTGMPSLTEPHTIVCTTEYAAPERFASAAPVGPPADVWSLGITMFRAIEGYSPFRRLGEYADSATVDAVLRTPLPPLRTAKALAGLLTRMLTKDQSQRPRMAEVEAELCAVLDGWEPVRVPLSRPAAPGGLTEADTVAAPAASRARTGARADAVVGVGGGSGAGVGAGEDSGAGSGAGADAGAVSLDELGDGVAVAWLLSQSRERAAAQLRVAQPERARRLFAELAEVRPDAVADLLGIWTEAEAGSALGLLTAQQIAGVLNALALTAARDGDMADVVRALRQARRPAVLAVALCGLPDSSIVATLGRLGLGEHPVAIYQSFKPEIAARLFVLNRGVIGPLLKKTNQAFQAQVQRFLGPQLSSGASAN